MSYYPGWRLGSDMTRSNLTNLIVDARKHWNGAQCSGYKWRAHRRGNGNIEVWHWHTHMITVLPNNSIVTISDGWGSPSDKSGISKIKSGLARNTGDYDNVYKVVRA